MNFLKIITSAALTALCLSSCSGSADESTDEFTDEKTYAETLSDNLDAGQYYIDMVISGTDYETDMPCIMIENGSDGYVSMTLSGVVTEFYTVDSATYMIMEDICCYQLTDETGGFGNGFLKIGEGDSLTDTSSQDGIVTEIYTSSGDSSESANETYTFTFDEESGDLLSFTAKSDNETTTADINSISWEGSEIVMPDITGWSDISNENIDEDTQLKITLYFMGVTEQMLEDNGTTFDEAIKLSDEELNDLLDKMEIDIYN
ncbi:MAG: hypothetical protein LUE12_07325 [Ruminococcus sp.]|nr:hypothetical protein [Ruminococcus sp.]